MTHSMRTNRGWEFVKTMFMILMLGLIWFTAFKRDRHYGQYRECLDQHYDVAKCKEQTKW